MEHVYIVNTKNDGDKEIGIGIFKDLSEAKKCAEAMSILKEREWADSDLYFDVRRTVLKGDKPQEDRYMTAACYLDGNGLPNSRKTIYYVSQYQLDHCIVETEEYKNIVKGL